jgi:predicted Zn-dependent protease with MMP-like domain
MSRSDRLRTDVERGFEALEAGKLEAAAAAVERAKRIDRKHPDVVALAAAVADADGNVEEALAQYRLLQELRPDDPMPRISIARIQLHDQGDPDAALDSLEAAFEFIDDEDDLIEGIYVRTEALLAREEPEQAREALAELSTSVIEDGNLALDLANLALSAGDHAVARKWIEQARAKDPAVAADAAHLLGLVCEDLEDRDGMVDAWLETRRLDMAAPPGNIQISEDEVERIAVAALHELPANIREKLERVPILIDDFPSEDVIREGFDPRSLGLFSGTPMPEQGELAPSVTNIHLYKRNLENAAHDVEHLTEEIRITVLHETAHYFGLDEDDLEALGLD